MKTSIDSLDSFLRHVIIVFISLQGLDLDLYPWISRNRCSQWLDYP